MAVDISATITGIWPNTEAALIADTAVGYDAQKARMIARAKKALYGSHPVPAEEAIPDLAAYWIADQTVFYLIPTARDYYMRQRITESKEGATITYYDKLKALDQLRDELEASLALNRADAVEAITEVTDEDAAKDTPAVSTAGMMVDPVSNAYRRGVPPGGPNPCWAPPL
jgi:hypothetical protein